MHINISGDLNVPGSCCVHVCGFCVDRKQRHQTEKALPCLSIASRRTTRFFHRCTPTSVVTSTYQGVVACTSVAPASEGSYPESKLFWQQLQRIQQISEDREATVRIMDLITGVGGCSIRPTNRPGTDVSARIAVRGRLENLTPRHTANAMLGNLEGPRSNANEGIITYDACNASLSPHTSETLELEDKSLLSIKGWSPPRFGSRWMCEDERCERGTNAKGSYIY
ncbi:hypothetical protein BaRGS_00009080 [Batillaria attramentaria]|uniref:Uncharacterized protein n=1 Tax=Batillaria attramentaria TaxID=370345 RepID=A0ABD0LJP9_9CAEN